MEKVKKNRTLFAFLCFLTVVVLFGGGYAVHHIVFQEPIPVLQRDVVTSPEELEKKSEAATPLLRVAIGAMISPKDTESQYRQLLQYLGEAVEMRVELVQRKTYAEINDLLATGDIQLAFICSGPYVLGAEQKRLALLSTPQIKGKHTYHSYLIVHKDSEYESLEDLQGKTFAFTDPDSNTGSLVPRHWLRQQGTSVDNFFSKTLFTYSHDNSIFAVAKGLVDGAAVDSLIWDFFEHNGSEITAKTKIIKTSDPYGIPPVVASPSMPEARRKAIQNILLTMHESSEGRQILAGLLIDRFILPEDNWYASIREMQRTARQSE